MAGTRLLRRPGHGRGLLPGDEPVRGAYLLTAGLVSLASRALLGLAKRLVKSHQAGDNLMLTW